MTKLHVILAFIVTSSLVAAAKQTNYSHKWSEMEAELFPGGTYKHINIDTFPGSDSISAGLVSLLPGGIRELHWHSTTEWAYVLNGTCRATIIESSRDSMSETCDCAAGDVWYIRPNEVHMVQGLRDGCFYLAGYNDKRFNERDAPSLSGWLSAAPAGVAAQGLGLTPARVMAGVTPLKFFPMIPLGPVPNASLAQYLAAVVRPPPLPVKNSHRFELALSTPHVLTAGGSMQEASDASFHIAAEMSGALLEIAPGGMRQMHLHTTYNEWQYVINGSVTAGVFTAPGQFKEHLLGPGDAGYAPMGSGHWFHNPFPEPAFVVLIYDGGSFSNIELPWILGNVPPQVTASCLNTSVAYVTSIDCNIPAVIPPRRAR